MIKIKVPKPIKIKKPKKVLYTGEKEYPLNKIREIIEWILYQNNIYEHEIEFNPETMILHDPVTLMRMKALGHITDEFNNEVVVGLNITVSTQGNSVKLYFNEFGKGLFFSQSNYDTLIKGLAREVF